MRTVGGTWQVGTKDGNTVYLDRYVGRDTTGDLIVNINMNPDEARTIGQLLIDKANAIDPKGVEPQAKLEEAVEVSRSAMSEIEMHYGEALDWINALEWWVRQQGLQVPTWHGMELAGWPGRTIENVEPQLKEVEPQ